jgi:thioredoxin-related protein
MKMKLNEIIGLTLASAVLCVSTLALAETKPMKAESIVDLEKKVLYSKPKVSFYNWYDYKRGMFVAGMEKKYVLVSFCTNTSAYCLKLDQNTYSDPAVKKLLEDKFVTVKVDGAAKNQMNINNKMITEKDLLKQFDIEGFPTMTFLDSEGKKVSGAIKGYLPPEKFLIVLKYISSDAYKSINFKDYMQMEENK